MRPTPARPPRAPVPAALRARALAFATASGGVAAVEFALILPVMCILLFGMNEVTLKVNIDRKLTLLSRSLADLTARTPTMTTIEMSNVFKAADSVMQPFDDVTTEMRVSSVLVTKSGQTYTGKIDWTCYKKSGEKPVGVTDAVWNTPVSAPSRNAGDAYPVPNGFGDASSFIVSEVVRPYTPSTNFMRFGASTLTETTPWPVRNVSSVTKPASCP